MAGYENDGRFPDDCAVEVRYPPPGSGPADERRADWPWLPGTIMAQCGPDEWHVVVEVRGLATLEDDSPAPAGTADKDLYYPACYRDSSELRHVKDGTKGSGTDG